MRAAHRKKHLQITGAIDLLYSELVFLDCTNLLCICKVLWITFTRLYHHVYVIMPMRGTGLSMSASAKIG